MFLYVIHAIVSIFLAIVVNAIVILIFIFIIILILFSTIMFLYVNLVLFRLISRFWFNCTVFVCELIFSFQFHFDEHRIFPRFYFHILQSLIHLQAFLAEFFNVFQIGSALVAKSYLTRTLLFRFWLDGRQPIVDADEILSRFVFILAGGLTASST